MIAIIQMAMRHSREDKAASHERIVEIAAARIRESGTEQPGVAEIMRAAGLTHGGFYKHFGSRDELVAEAVERALTDSEPRLVEIAAGAEDPLAAFADAYVSAAHRDDPASGCGGGGPGHGHAARRRAGAGGLPRAGRALPRPPASRCSAATTTRVVARR